ncbi:MAG: succinate dehydrogenase, hydrophobic membrane anchor protein [Acidiferrobacteraceae bacterium]
MSARNLGSSHSGTVEWILQRLTALYLGLFLVFLATRLAFAAPSDYVHWRAFWSGPAIRVATLVFVLSLLEHVWIGLRSVFRDYIRLAAPRLMAELAVAGALVAQALWAFWILWR